MVSYKALNTIIESRTATNSVVLRLCKREKKLSDNNFGAQTGVNLLFRHLFYSKIYIKTYHNYGSER